MSQPPPDELPPKPRPIDDEGDEPIDAPQLRRGSIFSGVPFVVALLLTLLAVAVVLLIFRKHDDVVSPPDAGPEEPEHAPAPSNKLAPERMPTPAPSGSAVAHKRAWTEEHVQRRERICRRKCDADERCLFECGDAVNQCGIENRHNPPSDAYFGCLRHIDESP